VKSLSSFDQNFNSETAAFRSNAARIIVWSRESMRRRGGRTAGTALLMLSIFSVGVIPSWSQESEAKQAQNPIAKLISVPFENDFSPHTGVNKDDSYVLQMKPVVPFNLGKNWNLITRTIIPVIQTPSPAPGADGATGLGDINLSLFLSPAKAGRIIWGAGPIISAPTATNDVLGTKKLSVGPTTVGLKIQGHWLYGVLINNVFSVAGPSARSDVNQMLMQPFVNYNMRHGWYLTSSPYVSANWEKRRNERWTVPVGGGVGKLVHLEKLPVNIYAQAFRNVERPDGTTDWSARLQAQFLFPRK
jgi:hypothetical protein